MLEFTVQVEQILFSIGMFTFYFQIFCTDDALTDEVKTSSKELIFLVIFNRRFQVSVHNIKFLAREKYVQLFSAYLLNFFFKTVDIEDVICILPFIEQKVHKHMVFNNIFIWSVWLTPEKI